MPSVELRKRVILIEDVFHEGGPVAAKPYRRGAILSVINAEQHLGESSRGNARSHSWWNAGKMNNANTIAARSIWPDSPESPEGVRERER